MKTPLAPVHPEEAQPLEEAPDEPAEDELPEDIVEEFTDDQGRTVRRVVKRTITTKRVTVTREKRSPEGVTMTIDMPKQPKEPKQEEVISPNRVVRSVDIPDWLVTVQEPDKPKTYREEHIWGVPVAPHEPKQKETPAPEINEEIVPQQRRGNVPYVPLEVFEGSTVEETVPADPVDMTPFDIIDIKIDVPQRKTFKGVPAQEDLLSSSLAKKEIILPNFDELDKGPEPDQTPANEVPAGERKPIFEKLQPLFLSEEPSHMGIEVSYPEKTSPIRSEEPVSEKEGEEKEEEVEESDDDEIVVIELQRKYNHPRWFIPLEEEQPRNVSSPEILFPIELQKPPSSIGFSSRVQEDRITPTSGKRGIFIPDLECLERPSKGPKEPPEGSAKETEERQVEGPPTEDAVEEYVDEQGVKVRRIVKRTVTTKAVSIGRIGKGPEEIVVKVPPLDDPETETIKGFGQPVFQNLEPAFLADEPNKVDEETSPSDVVEEFVDETGKIVKRVVKRTVISKTITATRERMEPIEPEKDETICPKMVTRTVDFPEWLATAKEPQAKYYTEEHVWGVPSVRCTPMKNEPSPPEVFEEVMPVQLESEKPFLPLEIFEGQPKDTFTTKVSTQVLPEDDLDYPVNIPQRKIIEGIPVKEETVPVFSVDRKVFVPNLEELDKPNKAEEGELPEDKNTYFPTFEKLEPVYLGKEPKEFEPAEIEQPQAAAAEISTSESGVEVYVDAHRRRIKRQVKHTVTTQSVITRTVRRDGERKVSVEQLPCVEQVETTPSTGEEEVVVFMQDNGRRVQRIIRQPLATTSVVLRSRNIATEEPLASTGNKPEESGPLFESASPVYLEDIPQNIEGEIDLDTTTPVEERYAQARIVRPYQRVVTTATITPAARVTIHQLEEEAPVPLETLETTEAEPREVEEVEEFVDDEGRKVKKVVKRVVSTKTFLPKGCAVAHVPVELEIELAPESLKFESVEPGNEDEETIAEHMMEDGRRLQRVSKTVWATSTSFQIQQPRTQRKDEEPIEAVEIAPSEQGLELQVAPTVEETNLAEKPEVYQVPELLSEVRGPTASRVRTRYLHIIERIYVLIVERRSLIVLRMVKYNIQLRFSLETFVCWLMATVRKVSYLRPVSWKVAEIQEQRNYIKVS